MEIQEGDTKNHDPTRRGMPVNTLPKSSVGSSSVTVQTQKQ